MSLVECPERPCRQRFVVKRRNKATFAVEDEWFVACALERGHPGGHWCPIEGTYWSPGVGCCDHWGPDWEAKRRACVYCSGTSEWQARR